MNRTFKLSLLCGGIFLAGAVAGGFAVKNLPRKSNQSRLEAFGPQQLRRLADRLELTKEQRKAISPVLQKTSEQLRVMRKESIAQATREVQAMDAAVGAFLTPVQRERLAALRAEDHGRMKKMMEEYQRRANEREPDSGSVDGRRDKEPPRRSSKFDDPAKQPPPDAPAPGEAPQ